MRETIWSEGGLAPSGTNVKNYELLLKFISMIINIPTQIRDLSKSKVIALLQPPFHSSSISSLPTALRMIIEKQCNVFSAIELRNKSQLKAKVWLDL